MRKVKCVLLLGVTLIFTAACSDTQDRSETAAPDVCVEEDPRIEQRESIDIDIVDLQIDTIESIENTEVIFEVSEFKLDILQYLNDHYPIEGVYYELTELDLNEETGRYEYDILMRPATPEEDEELTKGFKSEDALIEGKTSEMYELSRDIISDLPLLDESIHIYMVSYASVDIEFSLTLVQDKAQDTIK